MMLTHSLGRGVRNYPERVALAAAGKRSTFRQLHARVGSIAAALCKVGFEVGDRLAILLPNEPEYIELVYACAWLGVVVVPLNTRASVREIDHILADATPRGLIRHSSLPAPTEQLSCVVPRALARNRAEYTLYSRATWALAADFRPFLLCPSCQ